MGGIDVSETFLVTLPFYLPLMKPGSAKREPGLFLTTTLNSLPVDFGPSDFWSQCYGCKVSKIFVFVLKCLGSCHFVVELFSTLIEITSSI